MACVLLDISHKINIQNTVCHNFKVTLNAFFSFFQSMESDGAIALFERSVQYRKLIYKTYIGDDCYSAVGNSIPYGPLVYITKEQCSAHIIKRMGTSLRTIVKNNKGNR